MRFWVKPFAQLSASELYALMRLRQEVFVVEQNCAYLDADGHDAPCIHVWCTADEDPRLLAALRVVPPGEKYAEASIGRVVSASFARRTGAGRAVVERGLVELERAFGVVPVRISAQQYLERFYRGFGFETVSAPYDEDGIPHIEMLRPALR
jgi:ElaA protein